MLNEKISLLKETYESFFKYMSERLVGMDDTIKKTFITFMSKGHLLIEGPPGLGKTTFVRHFSKFFDLGFSRVQFTPDLMPLDIIGSNIIEENEGKKSFRFYKGPIFANIVLGDEINRATPKTQSACLEAMEEKRITFLGITYPLPEPFMLIATQNSIELEGTYPLPEAQVDRFFMKLYVNYPEFKILKDIVQKNEIIQVEKEVLNDSILKYSEMENLFSLEKDVIVLEELRQLISHLIVQTHPERSESELVKNYVLYGASPRAAIALIRGAKWNALIDGRLNISFDDIMDLAFDILNHRIILNFEGESASVDKKGIIEDLIYRAKRQYSI